jgi:hypothetical protein
MAMERAAMPFFFIIVSCLLVAIVILPLVPTITPFCTLFVVLNNLNINYFIKEICMLNFALPLYPIEYFQKQISHVSSLQFTKHRLKSSE